MITFLTDPAWRFSKKFVVHSDRVKDSLTLMKDWASWMSGIQTATLGAIGFIVKDGISETLVLPAVSIATFMGAALIASSYVLASLPSVQLRIKSNGEASEDFDVYEMPLFGWTTKVTLGYIAALQHVFWFLGLAAAAWFFISALQIRV